MGDKLEFITSYMKTLWILELMCFYNKGVALKGSQRSLFVSENFAQVPQRKILQL